MMLNLFLLFSVFACRKPDYQLLDPDRFNHGSDAEQGLVESSHDDQTANDSEEEQFEDSQEIHPDDIQPNMRLDVAIQHMGWGEMLTRCQIQVAFNRRWFAPPEEDSFQPPPPEPPEEPGDCVFFSRERPEPEEGSDPHHDNWYISGDISGPEVLYLHSIEQTIELDLVRAEDGLVRYEMGDCRQETFPFGEVFDLEIPGSDGDDAVPAAYIEEALVFGPNIRIETPETDHMHHQWQGYAEDGLFFSWSFDDVVPSMLEERMMVRLTNNSNQPWNYDEGMECLPDTREEIFLQAEDLLQFTLAQYLGENIFSIGLNIHGDYYGPEREDPWGNIFRTRVNISRGGMMELAE